MQRTCREDPTACEPFLMSWMQVAVLIRTVDSCLPRYDHMPRSFKSAPHHRRLVLHEVQCVVRWAFAPGGSHSNHVLALPMVQ